MKTASDILDDFYEDIVAIYGLCEEIDLAQDKASKWYSDMIEGGASESNLLFGNGAPMDIDATYQYKRKISELHKNVQRDGPNAQAIRKMAIVNAYACWEHKYRKSITDTLNSNANQLQSKVFADLNKYRQAVLHVQSRLDKDTEVFDFCKKGAILSLSKEQFHELFKLLVEELNSISKTYFTTRTDYSLDIYLNQI